MTWPNYSPACRKAVNELLKKGGSLSAYRANPQVGVEPTKDSYAWRFEREVERRFKVKHAVAVNSGTAALHCALWGLGSIDPKSKGGEVVVSPYTFSATVSAIVLAGYVPVFADVDPYTFCITPETVKHVITKRTRAILPVHIFGQLADVRGLKAFGLPVVEDACQSVGARNADGFSGTQGIAGGASANGGKNIPAGEFGFLTTNDDRIATQARYLMNHGENFHQPGVGLNYRPNEVTACIAYHGLLELEERNQRRIDLVKRLRNCDTWTGLPIREKGRCMEVSHKWPFDGSHVYYVVPFTTDYVINRGKFAAKMRSAGIPVGEGYITPPLHKYKAFRKYQTKPLPVVEELSSKTLCILSTLTPDRPLSYADHVADCMRKALE